MKVFDGGKVAGDALALWICADVGPRLYSEAPFAPQWVAALIGARLILGALLRFYGQGAPMGGWKKLLASHALWLLAAGALVAFRAGPVKTQLLVLMAAAHTLFVLLGVLWYRYCQARLRPPPGEELRACLLVATALVLVRPFDTRLMAGTGDAKLYGEAMADFLAQVHAGIFPPLVSQSEVAPFGAIFPFRMATYHFYLGVALDALTAGHLTVYAVQHLTLMISMVAGALAMYAVLRRLTPPLPWLAAALTALYVGAPVWLGALYSFNMFFTVMALPWLPIAFYTIARPPTAGMGRAILNGAALAMVWFAHPPIGLWASIVVVVAQAFTLLFAWPGWRGLAQIAVSWLVFAFLCAGLWVSISEVSAGTGPDAWPVILRIIHLTFPGLILAPQNPALALINFQPGYAILAILAGAAILAARHRDGAATRLVAVAALLLVLILPVPWVTAWLWQSMPPVVAAITNIWPLQRIVPVLVAIAPLAAILACRGLDFRRRRAVWALAGALSVALVWSALQVPKYFFCGRVDVRSQERDTVESRSENSPLLLNWLAYYYTATGTPPDLVASEINDPVLLNRVLTPDGDQVLASNFDVARAADAQAKSVAVRAVSVDAAYALSLPLTLAPGKRYLLSLQPGSRVPAGTLRLFNSELNIETRRLVGGGPQITLPIWTSSRSPQTPQVVYYPDSPYVMEQAIPNFLTAREASYDRATMPVRIERFAPYRARVTSPAVGSLETHRLFVKGYRARVNGLPAPVSSSPSGLAMVPVPAGVSTVDLDYVGSPRLRLAMARSAAGWAGVLILVGIYVWRRLGRPLLQPTA